MEYDQDKYNEEYWKPKENLELKHFLMCSEIYKAYMPKVLLDYGCGYGQFVKVFNDMAVDAWGYEPSKFAASQSLHSGKLSSNPATFKLDFDTVICMDVAEHVPIEEVDEFFKKISECSTKSFIAIFSICFKGDPHFPLDETHVTERTREWWEYKMLKAGFEFLPVPNDWIFKDQMIIAKINKEVESNGPKN